jgi:hypothetical protein
MNGFLSIRVDGFDCVDGDVGHASDASDQRTEELLGLLFVRVNVKVNGGMRRCTQASSPPPSPGEHLLDVEDLGAVGHLGRVDADFVTTAIEGDHRGEANLLTDRSIAFKQPFGPKGEVGGVECMRRMRDANLSFDDQS